MEPNTSVRQYTTEVWSVPVGAAHFQMTEGGDCNPDTHNALTPEQKVPCQIDSREFWHRVLFARGKF